MKKNRKIKYQAKWGKSCPPPPPKDKDYSNRNKEIYARKAKDYGKGKIILMKMKKVVPKRKQRF